MRIDIYWDTFDEKLDEEIRSAELDVNVPFIYQFLRKEFDISQSILIRTHISIRFWRGRINFANGSQRYSGKGAYRKVIRGHHVIDVMWDKGSGYFDIEETILHELAHIGFRIAQQQWKIFSDISGDLSLWENGEIMRVCVIDEEQKCEELATKYIKKHYPALLSRTHRTLPENQNGLL